VVKAVQHTTVETVVTTVAAAVVLDLCEAGRYREAERAVQGVPADTPDGLLAHGVVAVAVRDLETAKNYLSAAAGNDGEFRDRARFHLAVAYWFGGEAQEAKDLLRSLPDSLEKLLLRAIIETAPPYRLTDALRLLDAAAVYQIRPALQARLHNQRGLILRKMGETDRAIQEYEAAIYFFELDQSDCVPLVINNLAGVYLDYGETGRAHEQVDKAIRLLANDLPHLGKAYDQKARIFIAEQKYDDAKRWSEKAVSVLRRTDRREWLSEALITKSRSQRGLEQPCGATLDEAEEIGRYLQRDDLLVGVYEVRNEIARSEFERAEKLLIQTTLKVCKGSFRAAGERLHLTHPTISKLARRYGLKK
jgi:tetratricopeptide (TPR) repeat protein